MHDSATGITWYRKVDYATVLSLFSDSSGLPRTYEDWLKQAKAVEREVRRSGGRAIRAYIDPVEFPIWCQKTGNRMDASGRMAFGSAFAAGILSQERAASTGKTKAWKVP
jgi:hypothetical protein